MEAHTNLVICQTHRNLDDATKAQARRKGISAPAAGEEYMWGINPDEPSSFSKITVLKVWTTEGRCRGLVRYSIRNGEGTKVTTLELFVFLKERMAGHILTPAQFSVRFNAAVPAS